MPRSSICKDGMYLLDKRPFDSFDLLVNHSNLTNRTALSCRWIIQISALSAMMLVYWTNMAKTGDGGLGSDSGEGA